MLTEHRYMLEKPSGPPYHSCYLLGKWIELLPFQNGLDVFLRGSWTRSTVFDNHPRATFFFLLSVFTQGLTLQRGEILCHARFHTPDLGKCSPHPPESADYSDLFSKCNLAFCGLWLAVWSGFEMCICSSQSLSSNSFPLDFSTWLGI